MSVSITSNRGGFKNKLIGGDFRTSPWQRGTSFTAATTPANSDDTYLVDNWLLISDGNDIVDLSQDTDGELISTIQTINKQFGYVQVIENKNIQDLLDVASCSLSIEAKASAGLANIRATVLAWTSTADAVTSDVVGTWAGAGTDPTWATNWTAEVAGSNLALSTSYQTFTISNIVLDAASTANLAVVIWLDDTDGAVSDTLTIRRVQLEAGPVVTDFEDLGVGQVLRECQRYYAKTFPQGTAPAQSDG